MGVAGSNFEDEQMILWSLFDISTDFRFPKNLKSLSIQFLSHPWTDPTDI